jgi:hypothetical protein
MNKPTILKSELQAKADRLGELDKLVKEATDELKTLKEEFKAIGMEHVEGTSFVINLIKGKTTSLDRKKLLDELGPEAVERYQKVTEYVTVRVSPR